VKIALQNKSNRKSPDGIFLNGGTCFKNMSSDFETGGMGAG
jgi:hypothetical protein